jgi:hypothetical protein
MDFGWSAEQLELQEAVIEFGRRLATDDLIQRDHTETFSRALWSACADFGIQGLPFPVECGGSGRDILSTVLAFEALGYACEDSGLLFGMSAQMWSVQMPILEYGHASVREPYLERLCSGAWIGAHGMSEPNSGSDAFALRTSAVRRGDRYVLNGAKTFVSNAPHADLFLVFATIDPALGPMGITGFLVERGSEGIAVGKPIGKMGLRTAPMAEVVFEDCQVPVENRLGREGRGVSIFNDSMEWERTCILAGALGAMRRQLESSVRYAREREQFGKPIGDFQAVSHRLADMKVRLESSQLMLYHAAWAKERGEPASATSAMAKLFVSESYVRSSLDAIQIRGGYGYATEYEVEREMRDAVGSRLYSGTSDIQRSIIARSLGL